MKKYGNSSKKIELFATCLVALLGLSACNSGNSNTQRDKQPQSTPVSPDTEGPKAEILFPWTISRTSDDEITVKGIATDKNGVEAIEVNGQVATLEQTNDPNIVRWSARVPVAKTISVETTDSLGNKNSEADNATLFSGEVASTFTIDNTNQRLLGKNAFSDKLIVQDLISGQQKSVEIQSEIHFTKLVFADTENKLVVANTIFGDSDKLTLSTIDIESGGVDVIGHYSVPKTSGSWSFVKVSTLDYSIKENAIYINIVMFMDEQSSLSHIVKYDFNTKHFNSVVDGVNTNNDTIFSRTMAVSDSGILLTNSEYLGNSSYRSQGVQELTLDGSLLKQLTSESVRSPSILTLDHNDQSSLYGIDFEGITRVDLTSGESTTISGESEQTELPFSQLTYADVDHTNNRILVADSDLQMVVAVDMASGERSRFMHEGVGSGKVMINPTSVVYSEDSDRLFIADDGGNAAETIFEIDLSSGNRKEVGNIDRVYNEVIEDLVIDEREEKLYVVFGEEILTVDIGNGQTNTLTSNSVSTGANIGWLSSATLDKDNNRLLLTDVTNKQLLAVDLVSGHRTILSSAEAGVGTGDSLGSAHSATFDKENNRVIVAGLYNQLPAIFAVDLQTGNRQRWNNVCTDMEAFKEPDTLSISSMSYDSVNNQLHMVARGILTYDLDSGVCSSLQWRMPRFTKDLIKNSNSQWFVLAQGAVHQVDKETGESVIISK